MRERMGVATSAVCLSAVGALLCLAAWPGLSASQTATTRVSATTGSQRPEAGHKNASELIAPTGAAYLVIELPSKRVVAESRPDVLSAAIAPGSVIKIATLIAAMEQGVVDDATRIACHRTVTVDGRTLTCVHPDLHRPLGASEALGYSCNVFFVTVARRVPRAALDDVLVRMGLGPSDRGAPTALVALGLAGVRVTPRTLLDGFIRVTGSAASFRMSERTRAAIMRGLRMAATVGSASALGSAGIPALAKTGTALMAGGGYHGVVVAMTTDSTPAYAVVVIVPGGAGVDAAALAVDVLNTSGITPAKPGLLIQGTSMPDRGRTDGERGETRFVRPDEVLVGIARRDGGYDPVWLPLESYVANVVAGEISAGAPMAALEALAITVRTFAAANRGRHAAEGFDVCDLTHCQVVGKATSETGQAARLTMGLVLRESDHLAHVFYSASCGGHTEAPSHVWAGAHDPAYLPSRPDPACQSEAAWTSEIAEPRLRRALETAGLRGSAVRGFSVASRHPSGRAAMFLVEGMIPGRVDANVFQLAAGRVLGWQVVKSTLCDVRRSGVGFVLSGRGLGHGVGLCVRGAANRALQGRTRQEILAAYFPGLDVAALSGADIGGSGAVTTGSEPAVRVLLPEAERERLDDVRSLTRQLVRAMSSSLGVALPPVVDVQFHPTVEAYTRATGQPWWTSARTSGSRIELLPLDVLRKRGILELTLRHELVHVLADPVLRDRPLWAREGLAIVKAGELAAGTIAGRSPQGTSVPAGVRVFTCPADAVFRDAASPEAWRAVYEAAGRCVARALASGTRWQDLR